MDIQKPRRFETSDRAHADIFNEVLDQLNENDELVGQRAEEAEKNAKDYTDHGIKQLKALAQLVKITDDTGVEKLHIQDGDALAQLFDLGAGFHTFAINTAASNRPPGSAGYVRGTFLNCGSDGYGVVIATDTTGTIFTNTINSSEWKGWRTLETESNSQVKADKALLDAKHYVDTNFTNEKLTVLTNVIGDATASGDNYPVGITFMNINNNQTGYPLSYGFLKNEKWSNYRFTQYFYGNANYSGIGSWIRHWYSTSGWTNWEKISGFAHASLTMSGRQGLEKQTTPKIKFNKKVIDSHNAFDTTLNRFTAPNDGVYYVSSGLFLENWETYFNFHLFIYKNGSLYKPIDHYRESTGGGTAREGNEFFINVNGSAVVPLKKGDYIEIFMYVGYDGTKPRAVSDQHPHYNYLDIKEVSGLNFLT
ncbi:hypothetical protein [Bacillus sp. NSP9.1]|uniref:hypothetical protein n=1 Tax=Bacillus sp. NSP9.1 TaxID=1071078 RepID=UPI000426B425|nr:hypothetical protein [Bacillus sp. NSP9.1]QHZ46441.1 hypothetical protein M654_009095 [Bacillus sp. NSP9.1]